MNEKQLFLNLISIYLGRIATMAMIIPIFMAIVKFSYCNKPLKILFAFSSARFISSVFIQILIWATVTYRNFFLPIFYQFDIQDFNFTSILAHVINFSLLGWYFSLMIENKKFSLLIKQISILLFLSVIINYLFVEGYKVYNVFNSISSNIFCFILPLIHLWFIYKQDSKVPINKNPYFWISLGLLIPNLLGLITSIIGKKLRETDITLYLQVDIVYGVLQILGYLLIALGFYYARYTKYLSQKTTVSLPPQ